MKETRVYVINVDSIDEDIKLNQISDEQFMDISERQGIVFTLKGFENAFNNINVSTDTDYIRFIEVEV